MIISRVEPQDNYLLCIYAKDGRVGMFDVSPYLASEAFVGLKDRDNFVKVHNGRYFIEWECGADLSADTIESKWFFN